VNNQIEFDLALSTLAHVLIPRGNAGGVLVETTGSLKIRN
jgi:hypothetical protein